MDIRRAFHSRPATEQRASLVFLFTLALLLALPAHAVQILNVSNASNFDKTVTPYTIYGGVSGPTPPSNTGAPYNSCAVTTGGLFPCNNARIYADLRLVINFKSDTGAGKPTLFYTASGSSTTGGQALPSDPSSPTSVTAGSETYVVVAWSDICNVLKDVNGSGVDSNCNYSGTGQAKGTFKVGFQASATDQTQQSDGADIQIALAGAGAENVDSVVEGCDITGSPYGVCGWEVVAGDQKAILVNPQPIAGRTGPGLNFKAIRLYYLPVPAGQEGTPPFTNFNPAVSTYADLNIDSTTSGDLSVTPGRVEGLTNYQTYMFKLAMVDLAGNVGFYTSSGYTGSTPTNNVGDFYCENKSRFEQGTGLNNCHVATPGEVIGALKANSCFIATAAYGSSMAPQVEIFRQFRNHILLHNWLGQRFVEYYYEHGAKYAQMIAHNETARTLARIALWPLLGLAWLSLQIGAFATTVVIAIVFVGAFLLIQTLRRKRARVA